MTAPNVLEMGTCQAMSLDDTERPIATVIDMTLRTLDHDVKNIGKRPFGKWENVVLIIYHCSLQEN